MTPCSVADFIEVSDERTDHTQHSAHSGTYVPSLYGTYMDWRIDLRAKDEDENVIYCVLFQNTNAQA